MFQRLQTLADEAQAARAAGKPNHPLEHSLLEEFHQQESLLVNTLQEQRDLLLTFPCCWDQLCLLVRQGPAYLRDSYTELYTEGWSGSEVPPELFELRNLEHLCFSGCDLESVAGDYSKLKRLRTVGAEEVWTLRFLDDPSPALAPAVEEIYFSACNFEVFPVSVFEARRLRKLSISYCHNGDFLTRPFTSIPPGLSTLRGLEYLDLAGIGLRGLPEDLFQMSWLRELNLLSTDLPRSTKERLKSALQATKIHLDEDRERDDYES